jgi:hypothetical protein
MPVGEDVIDDVIGEHAYLVLRESDRVRFFDKSSWRRLGLRVEALSVETGLS